MSQDLARQKAQVRRDLRRAINGMSPADRAEESDRVTKRIRLELEQFLVHNRPDQAAFIAAFAPDPTEPAIPFIGDLLEPKTDGAGALSFAYPRVDRNGLIFLPVIESEGLQLETLLLPNGKKTELRQPPKPHNSQLVIPPSKIDLALVPGLGFTEKGKRLGRGGGYYDRFLEMLPDSTPTWGICFSVQMLDEDALPMEPHDLSVQKVIHG